MGKFTAKKDYIKRDLGHWVYTGVNVDISQYFGFVYLVINKTKNKFYIGKKQLWTYKKNTYTKTGKSFWRSYKTSSVQLQLDEKEGDDMSYHILGVFQTRAWCNYSEAWLQMVLCTITDRDTSGQRKWYNNQVAPIRYIPKEDHAQHETMNKAAKKSEALVKKYGHLEVIE